MSEWISVDERMPELATDVLVFGREFNGPRFTVAGRFLGGPESIIPFWASQETEESTRFDVTHWMPLPAPPVIE